MTAVTGALLSAPILLPLFGAGLALVFQRHSVPQQVISVLVLAGVIADAVALLVTVTGGPVSVQVGGWAAPIGITLIADRLSALLVAVSSVVILAVLLCAVGQGISGLSEAEAGVFYPVYLALTAGVCLCFLSGDLFNLFVGFEVMLISSYVLLTLAPTRARVRAGMTYVVTSLTSSLLFLTTVALVYAATGTVNLADLAGKMGDLPAGLRGAFSLLLLVVFGIKAAIVPLHLWLPDSYPTALARITALFAALLTKVAVYALIRTQTLLFPNDEPSVLMLALALATMLVGIGGALVQQDINRVLSFTLVSHIGYMVFGLALFSLAGLGAAIFYLVHHIVVQGTLFLVSGLIRGHTGTVSLPRLGGLVHATPMAATLFFIPALSLSGIPPFAGFVAKLGVLQAGLAAQRPSAYVVTGAAVVTSLLTLLAMTRVWTYAFWGGERAPSPPRPQPLRERRGLALIDGATMGMVGAGLAVAALAGPLSELAGRAAHDLLQPAAYEQAVLGDEARSQQAQNRGDAVEVAP